MSKEKKAPPEVYKKVKTLGEGSFGKAYLVECQSDKSLAVIKQIDITQMSEEEKKETLDEAKIMENLTHPNIIHFREVYKTKRGKLWIVMDYADGGDLQKYLKGTKKYLKEDLILDWFTQIWLAMKHVHDRKILHRDLKSQNIFLTKSNFIKLGDFGIARVLSHTKDIAKTVVGTPYYLSPEIIENRPYSFSSDIWSLGVLLYEMWWLRPPFDAGSLHELASKILKGKYSPIPTFYSDNMSLLIGTLLKVNPKDRPNINQILKFPLLGDRIPGFLSEDTFKDEFSHTIIHNKMYFEKPIKKSEAKEEEEETKLAPIQEEETPEEYYKKYVKYINKWIEAEDDNYYDDKALPQKKVSKKSYDREDYSYDVKDSIESSSKSESKSTGGYNFDDLDFEKFATFMGKKYGEERFKKGFEVVSKYKNERFDKKVDIETLLKGILSSEANVEEFLGLCSSYILLENYASSMSG